MLCRFFYAFSFPLLVAGIGYMLNYMPAANVSWFVKVDVALSWCEDLERMSAP